MADDPSRATEAAARRARRVPLRDIRTWIAPWLAGVLLAGVTLLGFFTADDAQNRDSYAAGLVTAGLGLVALIWLVKRAVDGPSSDQAPDFVVMRLDSLLLLIALLTAVGIGGLFLAADTRGATQPAGYALFVVCLAFIARNLKYHYDRTDARRSGGDAPD